MDKTFNPTEAEARIYAAWEAANAFAAGANAKPGKPPFSIMIPPPNVTGSLHMGHAFNNTLQDILVRWHRMRGFDTLWQPGTDHAGIATQMVTERDMAANGEPSRREMGREAFEQRVWQQKERSEGTILGQLKRLGASCDWSRTAFTMDAGFHDAVLKVFVDLYDKKIIYRGKRLVNWDPHFETAISDLEVESTEVDGHMWHFRYPLAGGETYEYVEKDEDGNVTFRETRDWISIATTRPETMLGDGAVAVHPSDERYAPIVGKLCEIPVGPKEHRRQIPIITDDYPDPAFGSGAVKITGAHDFNDYAVAQRNGIPLYVLMDTKGAMRADGLSYDASAARAQAIAEGAEPGDVGEINLVPDHLRGLDRLEARRRVVDEITTEGLAVMVPETDPRLGRAARTPLAPEEGGETRSAELVPLVEPKKIMQPIGDRSKVVIEPMLTDQWFVDTARIVQPAIDAVRNGDVRILPERDEKVYFHWLENIEPWCISRQLWWGHRIPVWYGPKWEAVPGMKVISWTNGETVRFCATSEAQALEMASTYYGRNAVLVADERAAHDITDGPRMHEEMPVWRDPDVLDTWFSSGLWPIGTLGWPEDTPELRRYFPTSALVTGHDIIFFWVARMMMMQLEVVGRAPFRDVYVHALVRDEKGKKMSKSLGNVLDPLDLIDEYGADAVRFTLAAMAAMGRDLKLSKDRIAGYRNFGTKLWNAFRFAEMNGATPDLYNSGAEMYELYNSTAPVNRWIVGETARVHAEVDAALSAYRFDAAANALYSFVWGRVCDWYLELSKPLLMDGSDAEKAETRATLAWVLDQCLILLHPFMPFVTEDLWGQHPRPTLLIHADWPEYDDAVSDPEADAEMTWVIALIEAVRSARGEVNVPAALQIPLLVLELDNAGEATWNRNAALIQRLARIESLETVAKPPKGAVTIPVRGGTFALPLEGIIDVAAESDRLQKAMGKLDKDIAGLSGRLRNPRFRDSAPPEIVAETEALLAEKSAEQDRLKAAQARLAELA
ncbi:valyl-tRNA synthetase [Oceaniovalibus guishaninsula JLT2003]|uniref:Valine--tRNA ligase n=1 Tax=Oceaniovalibus guishaninsula JLT2003 TaxID=1231392 RepID=K2GMT9_9RHOB|nr:valine--tRNA ligase [Oceaniovalibus guishaninsula]EKE44021.1 valyl-tRNA synthetase [Oceaniovalibus guishaninsula JLT2003]